MEFIKIFGYVKENDKFIEYKDGLGNGFSDLRHMLWIAITIILFFCILKLLKNNKKEFVRKSLKLILIFMFFQRVIKQIIMSILGAEIPVLRSILPIQMCSILIYLLPLTVIFNLKLIKLPVYILSIIGGTITILDGGYFESSFITLANFESIFAHTVMVIASISMLKIEDCQLTIRECIKTLILLLFITMYATTANCIFGNMGHQTNYLYLVSNMLPNDLGGDYFVYIYMLIFFVVICSFYVALNLKNKEFLNTEKEDFKKNKSKYILIITVVIITVFVLILLNNKYGIRA